MRSSTRCQIHTYFQQIAPEILWPSDLSNLISEHRHEWGESNLSVQQMMEFLLKEGLLLKAEFKSLRYMPITRYIRGKPSPYELAMSLRRDSFLCHRTALTLHGLEPPATTIYVNKEQGAKPAPEGIMQEGINRAFKNGQRQSKYIFRYRGSRFVLISGKGTDKAGVVRSKGPQGEAIDTTDLERTLVDIVVRPAYAGGLKREGNACQEPFIMENTVPNSGRHRNPFPPFVILQHRFLRCQGGERRGARSGGGHRRVEPDRLHDSCRLRSL